MIFLFTLTALLLSISMVVLTNFKAKFKWNKFSIPLLNILFVHKYIQKIFNANDDNSYITFLKNYIMPYFSSIYLSSTELKTSDETASLVTEVKTFDETFEEQDDDENENNDNNEQENNKKIKNDYDDKNNIFSLITTDSADAISNIASQNAKVELSVVEKGLTNNEIKAIPIRII